MPINQKLDNQLDLALDLTSRERVYTDNLNVGYNDETNTWELIIRYNGDLLANDNIVALAKEIEILTNGYAIVTVEQDKVNEFALNPEIEFVEKPKTLFFELNRAKRVACITTVQDVYPGLQGEGVLLAIIDSGIDYSHPDFRNEDGTTRIVSLWDQSIPGNPPEGFSSGTEYTREQINEALSKETQFERLEVVPSQDFLGHGTHVAGIAGGNGRASQGLYKGVAPKSEFIIVKLGAKGQESFPSTTELMRALLYVNQKAQEIGKPVAINLSFGHNTGSHDGKSLFETYIDTMANDWKTVIAVGSGNEGITARHTAGELEENEEETVQFSVSTGETNVYLQLWKSYLDDFSISLQSPAGRSTGFIKPILGKQELILGQTRVLIYYGKPDPYNIDQEIYIQLIPAATYVDSGIWTLYIKGENIVEGHYDLWLPSAAKVNPETRFLRPVVKTTLTVPSTAYRVITVGAYDSVRNSIAPFSGRGFTRETNFVVIKPDLVAPGVDIMAPIPGGGYDALSGTSMATPFVTGASALLMEWGIVRGNDPFLYGEKVKAYLQKGAERTERLEYPNMSWGYGTLCLANVFNQVILTAFNQEQLKVMPYREEITSEDYYDLLIYDSTPDRIVEKYNPCCSQKINDEYTVIHIEKEEDFVMNLRNFIRLMGTYCKKITTPGVPFLVKDLELKGKGVLVGIIDSGIDYNHDVFKYDNNTSKIVSIWDQTLKGNPPEGFYYGTEYTREEINDVIMSDDPYKIIPTKDNVGSGTFLAGVAAGRKIDRENFMGTAPEAELVVVKLKEAKNYLKEFFLFKSEEPIYQTTDVMMGIKYLVEKAKSLDKPLVIINGLGTNQGSHDGNTYVEDYMDGISRRQGTVITVAAGDERERRHHYSYRFNNETYEDIRINIDREEKGLSFSIWSKIPDQFSIGIISPTGEVVDSVTLSRILNKELYYMLGETSIYMASLIFDQISEDEVIFIRMENPTSGIWTFRVLPDLLINGAIDAWLPREGWINKGTYFQNPNENTTVTVPGTANTPITTGAYNTKDNRLYISSSLGPTRDEDIKPDLVAPGVHIIGPLPGNKFGTITGTGVSAAITGGASALLLEWGILQGNDPEMNTNTVKNYLLRGAYRQEGVDYPNVGLGYGLLDIDNTLNILRLQVKEMEENKD